MMGRGLRVFGLCLALAVINLGLKLYDTPSWFDGTLARNHQYLLDFSYFNNEQSRLLQFLIPEALVRTFGVSVELAYIVQRLVFVLATFCLFYRYATKWFDAREALACVVIMACLMPLTYRNHLQESAPLLCLTFLGLFWALREEKTLLYVLIFMLGGLNNETVLFIPAVYFFVSVDMDRERDILRQGLYAVLLAIPAYAVVGTIRWMTRERPHLGGAFHLWENLGDIGNLLVVFNVFWVLAFLRFKHKPRFLRRALMTVPLFIAPHMVTGIITETRQMIPLSFIIIPAAVVWWTQRASGLRASDPPS